MTEYLVTWTVQVTAASRQDAAEMALEIQRDPYSRATVFSVRETDAPEESTDEIDLEEEQ